MTKLQHNENQIMQGMFMYVKQALSDQWKKQYYYVMLYIQIVLNLISTKQTILI